MRLVNIKMIDGQTVSASITSAKVDINQIFRFSAQVITAGGATATGSLQFQVSNDPCAYGNVAADFTPTNWSSLGSAVTVSATPSIQIVAQQEISYRWLRCVYTDGSSGAGDAALTVQICAFGV